MQTINCVPHGAASVAAAVRPAAPLCPCSIQWRGGGRKARRLWRRCALAVPVRVPGGGPGSVRPSSPPRPAPPLASLSRLVQGTTLKAAALALGHCTEEQFAQWVRPEDMLGPK